MNTASPLIQDAAELLLDQVGPLRLRSCPYIATPRQEAFPA
jgi:hypothetical protein